jgi:type I restriction enzyme S subunit
MDGWFVSNEYPAFDVDAERAVAEFLNLSICQPAVWKDLAARTVGMGHRRQRLHPDALLEYEIEIPPIDDQQCIARSVRAATEVGDAARGEAAAARDLAEAVYASLAAARKLEPTELRHVMKLDLHRVDVETEAQYRPAGVKIAGGGLFWRDPLRGDETTYKSLHRLMAHQVVYRKLTAWEGPITVVPPAFEGAVVSPEFPTFTLDRARLEPDFMAFICRRPAFHAEMKARGTGTAERRNRLKPQDFLEITVGLPDLEGQRRIAAIERAAVALVAEAEAADRTALAIRDRVFSTRTLTGARR